MYKITACNVSTARVLRFRRWSRKAYAAFISRLNVVTIGQLAGAVSERLRNKSRNSVDSIFFTVTEKNIVEDDVLDIFSFASIVASCMVVNQTIELPIQTRSAIYCVVVENNIFTTIIINSRAWCHETSGSLFYNRP